MLAKNVYKKEGNTQEGKVKKSFGPRRFGNAAAQGRRGISKERRRGDRKVFLFLVSKRPAKSNKK